MATLNNQRVFEYEGYINFAFWRIRLFETKITWVLP